jgi:hypothetical protein
MPPSKIWTCSPIEAAATARMGVLRRRCRPITTNDAKRIALYSERHLAGTTEICRGAEPGPMSRSTPFTSTIDWFGRPNARSPAGGIEPAPPPRLMEATRSVDDGNTSARSDTPKRTPVRPRTVNGASVPARKRLPKIGHESGSRDDGLGRTAARQSITHLTPERQLSDGVVVVCRTSSQPAAAWYRRTFEPSETDLARRPDGGAPSGKRPKPKLEAGIGRLR